MPEPKKPRWRFPSPARIGAMLRELLLRGLSPATLARTLAVGVSCSLLPFLGATSLLNLAAGTCFRMNHPLLQVLNQLLGPVQLLLIIPYIKLGEWLWRVETGESLSVGQIAAAFRDLSFGQFLERFGQAGVHAFSGWLLSVPLLFLAVYFPAQALLGRWRKA